MKTFMTFIAALLLAGCASQEVYTMQATSSQVHDLRDLDYDGVIEAREMCDDTILGASVDNDGCPNAKTVKQSFRIDVKFPNNSSELLPRHYSSLEQLAAFLDDQDGATVIIEGHASKTGNAGHNLMLSKDRAQAVADALVHDFDVPAERVEAIGYGDTEPLTYEDTDEAHETNRRVMATLSGSYSTTDMRWTIFTSTH